MKSWQSTTSESQTPETLVKVALAIVNPFSGKRRGPKALAVFQPILEQAGIEVRVRETTHAGHCAEICEKEDLSDVDIICPIGGDGTLHEAINGLMNRTDGHAKRVIIAIVPAGSGNTVAHDLKISSPKHAAEVVVAGKFRNLDVGKVCAIDVDKNELIEPKPMYMINLCGWAMVSQAMKTANSYRKWGIGAQYDLAVYTYLLSNNSYKAKVTWVNSTGETHSREGKLAVLSIQNTIHLGAKLPLCPNSKVDDGLLDLVVMENRNFFTNLITFSLAKKAQHLKRKQLTYTQVSEVIVEPSDARLSGLASVNLDGELTGYSPFKITCVPGALRVFC